MKGWVCISQPEGSGRPARWLVTATQTGKSSSQPNQTKYIASSTSWVFLPQSESDRASAQPSTARPTITANDPPRAPGSIPPNRLVIASTGRAAAIVASTGNSRAASLPSTTSALERSVARTSSKVPRALSWQITPAVAVRK